MDIHQLRPGMICYTAQGSGYVLAVDVHQQQVLLQREDEPEPFLAHISELLAKNPHLEE